MPSIPKGYMVASMYRINSLKIFNSSKIFVDVKDIKLEKTALIGESGSGKSLTLKALLNLLPSSFKRKIDLNFTLKKSETSFIPQNPFTSLSPLTKIKKNFFIKKDEIIKLLNLVNLDESVLDKFPGELSGGQIQRIVIALSLSNNPKLLLLDEPTTALDTKNKYNFINILKNLQAKLDFKFLFVTHDIEILKDFCDFGYILKDGKIIEKGNIKDLLNNPKESYTKKLVEANFANRGFRC